MNKIEKEQWEIFKNMGSMRTIAIIREDGKVEPINNNKNKEKI